MAICKHLALAQQQAQAVQNFVRDYNSPNLEGTFSPGNSADSPMNTILQDPFSPDYPWFPSTSYLYLFMAHIHLFICLHPLLF